MFNGNGVWEGLKKVKPCPGETQQDRASTGHLRLVFHRKPEYKGYKIIFQTNVFHWEIMGIHVPLLGVGLSIIWTAFVEKTHTLEKAKQVAPIFQYKVLGPDHGVGHPVPFGLPHCSSRGTEGRWWYLDRC
jgi:hypothetical protein